MKEKKTPEYTRRAIEKYKAGKYVFSVLLPADYKGIIKENESSVNGYINRLVKDDLTRRGLLPVDAEQQPEADQGRGICPY